MKIYTFEQRTPEWYAVRDLKLTASHAQEIGNCGKGLETLVTDLLADHFSNNQEESFSSKDMDRGRELETQAINIYELETGNTVQKVGFCEVEEYAGCSPDGLIGEDGGIEVKCLKAKVYLELVLSQKIDTKYEWQVQMSLLVTGRKWWDFCAYNPNFKKSLFIKRILPDIEKQTQLLKGIEIGKQKIKEKLAIAKAFMELK